MSLYQVNQSIQLWSVHHLKVLYALSKSRKDSNTKSQENADEFFDYVELLNTFTRYPPVKMYDLKLPAY
jgi:hypothetical protein